jgi:hypothetical protein
LFQVIPVDLFPHNPHFELIILFERVSQEELADIMEIKQEQAEVKSGTS